MTGTAILTAVLLEEGFELSGVAVAVLLSGGLYLKSCCSLGSAKPADGAVCVAPPSELRENESVNVVHRTCICLPA